MGEILETLRIRGRRLADRYAIPSTELGELFSRLNIEDGDAFVIVGLLGKKARKVLKEKRKWICTEAD